MDIDYLDETNRLILARNPRWILTPKQIRVVFNGRDLACSSETHLLRGSGIPVYFFSDKHVHTEWFSPSQTTKKHKELGLASYWSIDIGGKQASDSAYTYMNPNRGFEFLRGHIGFEWTKMDSWFEERDEVFVHAKDPFKRIDTVRTGKEIQVWIGRERIASTTEAIMLLEPGHPIRYYIPKVDIRQNLLYTSDTVTRCPYKGVANYFSIFAGGKQTEDVGWEYRYPTPESAKIGGMVCFFNERVDTMTVDGEQLAKPLAHK